MYNFEYMFLVFYKESNYENNFDGISVSDYCIIGGWSSIVDWILPTILGLY